MGSSMIFPQNLVCWTWTRILKIYLVFILKKSQVMKNLWNDGEFPKQADNLFQSLISVSIKNVQILQFI